MVSLPFPLFGIKWKSNRLTFTAVGSQSQSSWNIDYIIVNVTDSRESHFSTQKKQKNLDRKKTTITTTTTATTTLECPKNGTSRRLLRTENLFIIKCDCLEMETYTLPCQADQLKTANKEQRFLWTRLTRPVKINSMWDSSECSFLKNTYTDFKFTKLSEETVNKYIKNFLTTHPKQLFSW